MEAVSGPAIPEPRRSLIRACAPLAPGAPTRIGVAWLPGNKSLATSSDHRRRMLEHLARQRVQPAPERVQEKQLKIRLLGEVTDSEPKRRRAPRRRTGVTGQGKLPL